MTMTKVHAMTVTTTPAPWSGIDAGRREQVGLAFTSFRHFRRSRRSVKPAAAASPNSATSGRPRLTHPWPAPLELKGSHAYLRELRRMEMEAWERTGGDVYRPAGLAARNRVRSGGDVMAVGAAETPALAEFPTPQ